MTPEQSRRDEAGRWLSQARKDLNAARLLASPEPSLSVFHSQQAAEKAAKAFLVFHDVPYRKTHDLNELGEQCAALDSSLIPLFKEAADLTDYAVLFRYLDAPREPDEVEAMVALDTALRVVQGVSALLRSGSPPSFVFAALGNPGAVVQARLVGFFRNAVQG
jgi:HEPN domain-containing protein